MVLNTGPPDWESSALTTDLSFKVLAILISRKDLLPRELLRLDMSSIVVEGIRTVFFYERYFNYKPHKKNYLTNIQTNIYKKSNLNCPYNPPNKRFIKHLKHLEKKLPAISKK